MDEVRTYWQVASINHFCDLFSKQFKLPDFEPEELEQAFILDIIIPPKPSNNNRGTAIRDEQADSEDIKESDADEIDDRDETKDVDDKDEDYKPEQNHEEFQEEKPTSEPTTQVGVQNSRLVDLAIALLQPHFNTSLNYYNWENYLNRILDANWVGLEHYPSPLSKTVMHPDGTESIQDITFNDLTLSDRIDVIHALCDYRLWCEDVQDKLKDFPIEELRLESIGKDSHGYEYWYFSGTRLFRENKELSQDLSSRRKRIIELESKLVEIEKNKLMREKEEKKKAELEKARQLAAEAREAKRKQQEEEARSKRKQATPVLPLRTGLRERRSSAASNNHKNNDKSNQNHDTDNESQEEIRIPTTRSKVAKQKQQQQQPESPAQPNQVRTRAEPVKNTRASTPRNAKLNGKKKESATPPALRKKSPEEECREELEKIQITPEERKEAWCIECESLEDWEAFATRFEKTKSINEKYLLNFVNEYILPKIRAVYARKAAEIRRKEKELLYSLASRRVSTRLVSKKVQEEEEEKKALVNEAENRRKKIDAENRLRAELEREMRARQNRFVINGVGSTCSEDNNDETTNSRYNTRQNHDLMDSSDEFAGIIHPDKLSEFYEALELIVDSVRTSKHAGPFVDPVPETVPGYYDLIKEPMDLRKLRTKVEFREYRSVIELEKDFQLIVNNCERFNGPRNTYTKMAYKLWKSFRKNVKLYLQRDLELDEYETFIYPPAKPEEQNHKDNNNKEIPQSAQSNDVITQNHEHVNNINIDNDELQYQNHINDNQKSSHDHVRPEQCNSNSLTNHTAGSSGDCQAPTPSPIHSPMELSIQHKPPLHQDAHQPVTQDLNESKQESIKDSTKPATLTTSSNETQNLTSIAKPIKQQDGDSSSNPSLPQTTDNIKQEQELEQQTNGQADTILETCLLSQEPCEDIIIDSYDVTLPDENFFVI